MRLRMMFMIAALTAALPLSASTAPDTTALAKVNGDPVTVQDLLDAFTTRHAGHAKFLGGYNEAHEFLKILIDERLFIHEGYNIGLDQDESVAKLVDAFEKSKASSALITAEIDEKAKPSDEEVRNAWQSLNFVVAARQIAVDTRQEAEEIRIALLHGGDFDAFARTCSRAESSSHGGHIIANWGPFEPQWERVVFALEPGEISPVIETKDGFEVILADDRVDVPRPEFDKVKSQIETVLRQRKLDERKRALSEELWRKYGVTLPPIDATPAALLRTLTTSPDTVVATWNGGRMTVKDIFDERELRMFALFPPVRAKNEIDARIRATVNEPLAALEATERKLADTPEIAAAVQKYRDTMVENALFRQHVFKDVDVTDADIHSYYDQHKSEFVAPEQRHVAHVMVSNENDAKQVRSKLSGGSDFDEVAKKSSRDFVTAGSGGDLGWITADKVPAAFKEVLSLEAGALSKPIKSPSGWHIIKVLEVKPSRALRLDEVKDKVRDRALTMKQHAAQKFWLEKLRAAGKVEVDESAIKAFVAANEFKGEPPPQHAIR